MKKKSLTVIRNAQIVGCNSKSYNDKHPENPVSMRPISGAIRQAWKRNYKGFIERDYKLIGKLRKLTNLPHIAIPRAIQQVWG